MIPFLKKKINELQLRVYELKEMSINAGAIRYDKDPVQTSPNGGRLEKMVTEYCELERQIGFLKIDLKNQIIVPIEFESVSQVYNNKNLFINNINNNLFSNNTNNNLFSNNINNNIFSSNINNNSFSNNINNFNNSSLFNNNIDSIFIPFI